jgi:hypothetical protein
VKRSLLPVWLGALGVCLVLAAGASEPDQPPAPSGPPDVHVLEMLVTQSLQIADESDALRRAKGSLTVAEALADALNRASARGDHARAAQLGKYLTKVLDRGVSHNVVLIDPTNLDPARLATWKGLSERPEEIRKALNLPQTPPLPGSSVVGEAKKDKEKKDKKDKDRKDKDRKDKDRKDKDKKDKDKKDKGKKDKKDDGDDPTGPGTKKGKKDQRSRSEEPERDKEYGLLTPSESRENPFLLLAMGAGVMACCSLASVRRRR